MMIVMACDGKWCVQSKGVLVWNRPNVSAIDLCFTCI